MDVSGLRREPLTAIPLTSGATGPRPLADKQGSTYQPTDMVSKTMLGSAIPTAALVESLTDFPVGIATARLRLEAVILPAARRPSPTSSRVCSVQPPMPNPSTSETAAMPRAWRQQSFRPPKQATRHWSPSTVPQAPKPAAVVLPTKS